MERREENKRKYEDRFGFRSPKSLAPSSRDAAWCSVTRTNSNYPARLGARHSVTAPIPAPHSTHSALGHGTAPVPPLDSALGHTTDPDPHSTRHSVTAPIRPPIRPPLDSALGDGTYSGLGSDPHSTRHSVMAPILASDPTPTRLGTR